MAFSTVTSIPHAISVVGLMMPLNQDYERAIANRTLSGIDCQWLRACYCFSRFKVWRNTFET